MIGSVLCLLLVFSALAPARVAVAVTTEDGIWKQPSMWAPLLVTTSLDNRVQGGDELAWVHYNIHFDGYDALNDTTYPSWGSPADFEALELGYKDTGGSGCNGFGGDLGYRSGFPDNVYVSPDYTEDPDDAVLFIGDMPIVMAEYEAGRLWAGVHAAWACADFVDPFDHNPYFQVQAVNGNRPPTSYSQVSLNYAPAEETTPYFPPPVDGAAIRHDFLTPWLWLGGDEDEEHHDLGQFEDTSLLDSWGQSGVTTQVDCGDAAVGQGNCYMVLRPDGSTGSDTWLHYDGEVQTVLWSHVPGQPDFEGPPNIGGNTALQYQGLFRCESADCTMDIWLKGGEDSGWDATLHKRTMTIPSDHQWHFVSFEIGPGGETTDWQLRINTLGHAFDIDAQWVGSGI
jgi:hypothetical protein